MSKIIHFAWIQGEENLPDKYRENIRQWKLAFPEFEIKIWDDVSARKQWKDYNKYSDQCYHHATRADMIRARAIRDFGGMALDTDASPMNTVDLRKHMELNAFVVINGKYVGISNCLQWSAEPQHPFWRRVAAVQIRDGGATLGNKTVNNATGPLCYERVFKSKHWDLTLVTAFKAYKNGYQKNSWNNPNAFMDAGFDGTWVK